MTNYEDLKELMAVDQLKRCIPNDAREHFIDELTKWKEMDDLVDKLNEYEAAWCHLKAETSRDVRALDDKNKHTRHGHTCVRIKTKLI